MGHQYSNEEKIAAIQLSNKLGHYTWVIAELGYPSRGMLMLWVKEYKSTGQVARKDTHKYSEEQRKIAVDYYLNNGMSIKKTVTALGYPGKTLLGEWINADVPREKIRYRCKRSGSVVRYSKEQKIEAVSKYCGGASPTEISKEYGIAPGTVYVWKKSLLGSENAAVMKPQNTVESNTPEKSIEELTSEKDALEKKVVELQNEIYRLQMQKDILEKAGELLKKEKGIDLPKLTNKEKAVLINALRNCYRLKDLLEELQIAKSSYCYQNKTALRPDKYEGVRKEITDIFSANYRAYGYRRIHSVLKSKNIHMSEKTVRRIMREEGLSVAVISRKKYSSYKGEVSPEVPNLLQRNFHAEMPNKKWLTDITEFRISAGRVYLSPIIDCFDGMVVSWTAGTSPDAELVNGMLDCAIDTLDENSKPIIHSDRGCHYRWPGWIDRMDAAGLTRSMSRKACSPDNSACEGFFGRLKNEMFYGRDWRNTSITEFIYCLENYIEWYNNHRIKLSLNGMSPAQYRAALGYGIGHE